MTIRMAMTVGLIATGAYTLVPAASARAPDVAAAAQTTATQTAAVKKPAPKKTRAAARPSREENDPLIAAPPFSQDAVGWRLTEDPATGARLGLPTKVVPFAGTSRTGSRWSSAQGQIQVETFRLTEASLPALFEDEKKASRRLLSSTSFKPDSFVIAGAQGLKNFVVRADARGSEVRGFTVLYDQATEGTMSGVAFAMAKAFVAFPDPGAPRPPNMRRMVEYGTAIVVSGNGDLIVPAPLADECQAITVPGLGHAERVASDAANDLALLRVYGARNLVPAALIDAGAAAGDVTLVGIADPLGQEGDTRPATMPAHVAGQGSQQGLQPAIEPVPKLGFAGAAALDARGRLVGMVDLKSAIVAGGGAPTQTATLVPADAIRAFLQAQHVTPAAMAVSGTMPADQSVLRVICVRK